MNKVRLRWDSLMWNYQNVLNRRAAVFSGNDNRVKLKHDIVGARKYKQASTNKLIPFLFQEARSYNLCNTA